MNTTDYYESLVEELKLNGFDVRIGFKTSMSIAGQIVTLFIEMDTVGGLYTYKPAICPTFMEEFYRFVMCYGMWLSEYGRLSRIEERNKQQSKNIIIMKEPTKKQLDFIEFIEVWTGVKFAGKTRQEASNYIDENKSKIPIDTYISDWAIDNGY